MPNKKVNIGKKPVSPETKIDDWVATSYTPESVPDSLREESPKMKRLTIDVPEHLHRAIKMKSVEQGVPMADLLRDLLEKHFL